MHFAWWKFAWEATCNEVIRRYSFDDAGLLPRGHIQLLAPQVRWTLLDLYKRLHVHPRDPEDAQKRQEELGALYTSLDLFLDRKRTRRDDGRFCRSDYQFLDAPTRTAIWGDSDPSQRGSAGERRRAVRRLCRRRTRRRRPSTWR